MKQLHETSPLNHLKNQALIFQIISRRVLNCIILYKKFVDFFTINSFSLNFEKWVNFYTIVNTKYLIYSLRSFVYYTLDYFLQFKLSKLYLFNFYKVVECYTELIEYKAEFIENYVDFKTYFLPKKKTFRKYFNIDLSYQFFNFLKIAYIQLFSKIKKYIIYRKNIYFDFFSIRKMNKYELLFEYDHLKRNINLKKIPFYFNINIIKKFLTTSVYTIYTDSIEKPSVDHKKIFSLENFIDYTTIKSFEIINHNFQILFYNFLISRNIFVSSKLTKRKLFIFLNMRYLMYFTLYQSLFKIKNFNLFLFFLRSFEKKINTQIITKVHKNFLNLNAKILLIVTHIKKLKYHLCNFNFLNLNAKINLVFNRVILMKISLLKTRLISFTRVIEQLFIVNFVNIESAFYNKINKTTLFELFQKTYYTIKKIYKTIFLCNQKICTFIIFIKILSFIYFYKNFLAMLNRIIYVLNPELILDSAVHVIKYYFHVILYHKINFYKSRFEEITAILTLLIHFKMDFRDCSVGLDFCHFLLKKNFF